MKDMLDFTEGKFIYVKRQALASAIESKIKNAILLEMDTLRRKLTKLVKSKENAVNLLVALRRDKSNYSEAALYVDACLERFNFLEEQLEDLQRTLVTLPAGDLNVKLTDAQARYYGL